VTKTPLPLLPGRIVPSISLAQEHTSHEIFILIHISTFECLRILLNILKDLEKSYTPPHSTRLPNRRWLLPKAIAEKVQNMPNTSPISRELHSSLPLKRRIQECKELSTAPFLRSNERSDSRLSFLYGLEQLILLY
jgi:hypothetical protein